MNPQKKITIRQQTEQEQQAQGQQHAGESGGQEFASVEEMLRHDAMHTPVPPAIVQRLQDSIKQLPASSRPSWWRRLFGGSLL